jgi:hypothetical protein
LNDNLDLLPLTTKVDHLDYDMLQDYKYMQTKIIDVFKRFENVGHFKALKLRFKFDDNEDGT